MFEWRNGLKLCSQGVDLERMHCLTVAALAGSLALLGVAPAQASPRPLPPTFVKLEVAQFPKLANTACADNTRIVRVPSAGAPTIARGIAAASPRTTVLVRSGTYVENAGDYFALAMNRSNVCLRAVGGRVTLRAATGQNYGLFLTGNDVVLQGFNLRGFAYNVSLGRATGASQRRVTIQDVSIASRATGWTEGIVAYTDNRSTPTVPSVDGLLVRNVSIAQTDLGISCNAGPCRHWWLENVNIRGRAASEDSGADAFAIENGRQIAIVNSTFAAVAADGIDVKGSDVVVFGARVFGVGRNGIKLWRGGDVINSIIDGSGADAALVGEEAGRYRYLHVDVVGHSPTGNGYVGTWGYDSQSAVKLQIINSIFAENSSGGLYVPTVAGASVQLRNNLFADEGDKLLDLGESATYRIGVSDLATLTRLGVASGNRLGSPRFVDRGRRNYTPGLTSPARSGAARVPGLLRDILGHKRVVGSGPEIGAVEALR